MSPLARLGDSGSGLFLSETVLRVRMMAIDGMGWRGSKMLLLREGNGDASEPIAVVA